MSATLDEEELAKRFNWWWRSVYVGAKDSEEPSLYFRQIHEWAAKVLNDDQGESEALSIRPQAPALAKPGKLLGLAWKKRERSAFLYELDRRMTGKYLLKKPWIDLSEKQQKALEARWPDGFHQNLICEYRHPGSHLAEKQWNKTKASLPEEIQTRFSRADAPVKPGWTRPLPDSWNLHLNDNTLSKAFLSLIKSERNRLKVPNPRQHAGKARRPISWKYIELLDIHRLKLRTLSDGERSEISKARKLWKKLK